MPGEKVRSCGTKVLTALLWLTWLFSLLPSLLFVVLSLLTFEEVLNDVYGEDIGSLEYNGQPVSNIIGDVSEDHRIWALLGVTIVAPVFVFLFFLYGTMVLIGKTRAMSSKSYTLGMLHAGLAWLVLLMGLTGLTIHGFYDQMEFWEILPDWSNRDTIIAAVTYVLAYCLGLLYALLFILLFFFGGCVALLLRGKSDTDDIDHHEHGESVHHSRSLKHDSPVIIHEHHDSPKVKRHSSDKHHTEPVATVPVSNTATTDSYRSEPPVGVVVPPGGAGATVTDPEKKKSYESSERHLGEDVNVVNRFDDVKRESGRIDPAGHSGLGAVQPHVTPAGVRAPTEGEEVKGPVIVPGPVYVEDTRGGPQAGGVKVESGGGVAVYPKAARGDGQDAHMHDGKRMIDTPGAMLV